MKCTISLEFLKLWTEYHFMTHIIQLLGIKLDTVIIIIVAEHSSKTLLPHWPQSSLRINNHANFICKVKRKQTFYTDDPI